MSNYFHSNLSYYDIGYIYNDPPNIPIDDELLINKYYNLKHQLINLNLFENRKYYAGLKDYNINKSLQKNIDILQCVLHTRLKAAAKSRESREKHVLTRNESTSTDEMQHTTINSYNYYNGTITQNTNVAHAKESHSVNDNVTSANNATNQSHNVTNSNSNNIITSLPTPVTSHIKAIPDATNPSESDKENIGIQFSYDNIIHHNQRTTNQIYTLAAACSHAQADPNSRLCEPYLLQQFTQHSQGSQRQSQTSATKVNIQHPPNSAFETPIRSDSINDPNINTSKYTHYNQHVTDNTYNVENETSEELLRTLHTEHDVNRELMPWMSQSDNHNVANDATANNENDTALLSQFGIWSIVNINSSNEQFNNHQHYRRHDHQQRQQQYIESSHVNFTEDEIPLTQHMIYPDLQHRRYHHCIGQDNQAHSLYNAACNEITSTNQHNGNASTSSAFTTSSVLPLLQWKQRIVSSQPANNSPSNDDSNNDTKQLIQLKERFPPGQGPFAQQRPQKQVSLHHFYTNKSQHTSRATSTYDDLSSFATLDRQDLQHENQNFQQCPLQFEEQEKQRKDDEKLAKQSNKKRKSKKNENDNQPIRSNDNNDTDPDTNSNNTAKRNRGSISVEIVENDKDSTDELFRQHQQAFKRESEQRSQRSTNRNQPHTPVYPKRDSINILQHTTSSMQQVPTAPAKSPNYVHSHEYDSKQRLLYNSNANGTATATATVTSSATKKSSSKKQPKLTYAIESMEYETECRRLLKCKYEYIDLLDDNIENHIMKDFGMTAALSSSVIIGLVSADGSTNYRHAHKLQRERYKADKNRDSVSESTCKGLRASLPPPVALCMKFILRGGIPRSGTYDNIHDKYMITLFQDENTTMTEELNNSIINAMNNIFQISSINKIIFDCKLILCELMVVYDITLPVIPLPSIIDPKIGAWLLDPDDKQMTPPSQYQFDVLRKKRSSYKGVRDSTVNENGSAADTISSFIYDINHTFEFWNTIEHRLQKEQLLSPFYLQEMSFISITSLLQVEGLPFDKQLLQQHETNVDDIKKRIEHQVHQYTKHPSLNLSSPTQIAKLLYNTYNMEPPLQQNKGAARAQNKNHISVNEAALVSLSNKYPNNPIPSLILKFRHVNGFMKNQMSPLLNVSFEVDSANCYTQGRIYSSWNQTSTGTGRLSTCDHNIQSLPKSSANKPVSMFSCLLFCITAILMTRTNLFSVNVVTYTITLIKWAQMISESHVDEDDSNDLQIDNENDHHGIESENENHTNADTCNIPHTTSLHKCIRTSFVCSHSNFVLLSFDYSQMEMRLVAHVSEDKNLISLFKNSSGDIYITMASMCFNKTVTDVTAAERDVAKAVSLGIVYGMGSAHMSQKLKRAMSSITKRQCDMLIHEWNKQFPQVKRFMQSAADSIKGRKSEGAYIRTFSGRRRYLTHVTGHGYERAQAERQATNTIIQGSASDMVKCALLRIIAGLQADNTINKQLLHLSEPIPLYNEFNARTTFQNRLVRILMQLHDEIILECHEDIYTHIVSIVRPALEAVITGSRVRFPVNVKVGKSLETLKTIIKAGEVKSYDSNCQLIDFSQLSQKNDNNDTNNLSQQSTASDKARYDSLIRSCDDNVIEAMNKYQIQLLNWRW